MKPNFDSILEKYDWFFLPDEVSSFHYGRKDLVDVMKEAYNMGIQDAADNGECDCDTHGNKDLVEDVECSLNRSSILKLKIGG